LVDDVSDGASFERSLVALQAQVAELSEERDEYRKLVLHLREEVERLKRGLLGQTAERLPKDDAQLSLLMLGLALGGDASVAAPEPPSVEQTVAEHTRAKPVRKPLPSSLPREEIERRGGGLARFRAAAPSAKEFASTAAASWPSPSGTERTNLFSGTVAARGLIAAVVSTVMVWAAVLVALELYSRRCHRPSVIAPVPLASIERS
jgi:hypothetical protein